MKTFLIVLFAAAAAFADEPGLFKSAARDEVQRQWAARVEALRKERAAEVEAKEITAAGKPMRWLEKSFGKKPEDGWPLWISLHGGGGAPAPVNDSQWQNQARLYQPKCGLYIAPRAPTDNWNLWHEPHIDALFDRLIEDCVAVREVNPDKVYVLGHSAGGDGVYGADVKKIALRLSDELLDLDQTVVCEGERQGDSRHARAAHRGGEPPIARRTRRSADGGDGLPRSRVVSLRL